MTSDRDLWTDPKTSRLYNPRQILGNLPGTTDRPPYYDPAAWPDIRARMAEAGFWPLYEGKHIEQFLVDIRPIERWLSLEACERKYGKRPDPGPKLVVRAIARNTDERTCIAAILPERSCAGNSVFAVASGLQPSVMASVLNSFAFDFSIRLRTAGANLNLTYFERLAVPVPEAARALPTLAMPTVATTPACHVSHLADCWGQIWHLNRAVAEAYGLTPDEFAYILSTFPVFAHKRPGLYAYLQERVQEWKRHGVGAKVYAMGAAVPVEEAAVSPVPAPQDQPGASKALQQAAVLAWVVAELFSRGRPVSRFRVQKMLYFIEAGTRAGLFTEFCKQPAGPDDWHLRYQGPEEIAIRQRGWLKVAKDTHFAPGPNIGEAITYAAEAIDIASARGFLAKFHQWQDKTLELWTTVHSSAVELAKVPKPVTPETVREYIQATPKWRAKLTKENFTLEHIAAALEGLRNMKLVAT